MLRSVLTCLLGLLAACAPHRAEEGSRPPQVVLRGARLRTYEGSTLSITGRAARFTYERSTSQAAASQATLYIPNHANPQRALEVSAPLMESTLSTRLLTASGGVSLRSADGITAQTPRATYDAASRTTQGSEGVSIQGVGWDLRADTFSFNDESFSFEGSVHTVLGAAR